MDLNTIWFILLGVLFAGYAVLDGFDLGVGILHLFARSEEERRIHINSIGPLWDGNEVWLLTGGGALFAAFPTVYATVFSGFYLALMLLLTAFIARAVSFDFRGKVESAVWRRIWDWCFGLGSLVPALLLGVAYGNILRGIPLNAQFEYTGSFFELLNPFSLLVGLMTVALFTMHGAIFLGMKTEGALRDRLSRWALWAWGAFLILFTAASVIAHGYYTHLFESVFTNPISWLLLVLLFAALAFAPINVSKRKRGAAFLFSSIIIISALGLSAISLYPRLVPSLTSIEYSLTIYNACSSDYTLKAMLIIALLGMPLVIGYSIFVYRVFRGTVKLTKDSY